MNTGLLIAFLVTTTIAMVVPGPDMLFVLAVGLRGGPKLALLATSGVATGEALHITLAAAGLSALFLTFPSAFTAVRAAGVIYLLYLGIQSIRGRGGLRASEKTPALPHAQRTYLQGLLTNLGNPKMITFTIAFLPQFVDSRLGHVWAQFLILGAIFLAFEFAVDGTVGVFSGRIGRMLQRRKARRSVEIATGSIFIGLAARLAFEKR
jgi:threonine/homoserine/homoserine lactone efflux protein